MPQGKVPRPKQKNAAKINFKNSSMKRQCYKNAFFIYCSPET